MKLIVAFRNFANAPNKNGLASLESSDMWDGRTDMARVTSTFAQPVVAK